MSKNVQIKTVDGQDYEVTIFESGRQVWRQNGKLHRLDGPAVIHGNYKAWYKEGNLHRIGGPAVIDSKNWVYEWWLDGVEFPQDTYEEKMLEIKMLNVFLVFEGKKYLLVDHDEITLGDVDDKENGLRVNENSDGFWLIEDCAFNKKTVKNAVENIKNGQIEINTLNFLYIP